MFLVIERFRLFQEMVENMDSTRDVWAMQLDTIRNRIIRVELLVAVASFSLMVSTVPASFFGMNLTWGLEVVTFSFCEGFGCVHRLSSRRLQEFPKLPGSDQRRALSQNSVKDCLQSFITSSPQPQFLSLQCALSTMARDLVVICDAKRDDQGVHAGLHLAHCIKSPVGSVSVSCH